MTTRDAPVDQIARPTYKLDENVRRKIISETPAAKVKEKIERERQAFIRAYGSAFGETVLCE